MPEAITRGPRGSGYLCAMLLQANPPIAYVSQQLGHRKPSITFRLYAPYMPDASRRTVDLNF
jgi:integrase